MEHFEAEIHISKEILKRLKFNQKMLWVSLIDVRSVWNYINVNTRVTLSGLIRFIMVIMD